MAHGTPPTGPRIRQLLLGPRPLRRASDRLQVLAQVMLFSALLASIPIGFAVAVTTSANVHLQAVAQAAERHPVTARVVGAPPRLEDGSDQVATTSRATAVWTEESGKKRTGSVVVPAGTAAGATVRVWLDRAGQVTGRPLTDSDGVSRAVGSALVTVLFVVVGAFAAYGMALKALDRSRARRWATEWADVEPLWTRQSP